MPDQTFSEELYDDTALKDAVDRMASLIKTHATKAYVDSAVEQKQDNLTFDSTPTASSTNPVTSGGVKTALDAKQDTLIFDSKPTAESTKPVTSGGVYEAVSELKENLSESVSDLKSEINGGSTSNYIVGKNIDISGAIVDDTAACVSEKIPYTWTGSTRYYYGEASSDYAIAFYAADDSLLKRFISNSNNIYRSLNVEEQVTGTVSYIRLSFKNGYSGYAVQNANPEPSSHYWDAESSTTHGIIPRIEAIELALDGSVYYNYVEDKGLNSSGEIVDATGKCVSEEIPVSSLNNGSNRYYGGDVSTAGNYYVAFYDADHTLCGAFQLYSTNTEYRAINHTTQVSGTPVYVRFSFEKGYAAKVTENASTALPVYWAAKITEILGLNDKVESLEQYTVSSFRSYVKNAAVTVENGTITAAQNMDVRKNDVIDFKGMITSFTSLTVGHGYQINHGMWAVIDGTNITTYEDEEGNQIAQQAHGLTIGDYISVVIKRGENGKANIELTTSSGRYVWQNVVWAANRGDVFATVSGTLTSVSLSYAMNDINDGVMVFGDSYMSFGDSARWPYYCVENGFDAFLASGFPGANSEHEIVSFRNLIAMAKPKFVVWTLGMNNSDSMAINANWKACVDEVVSTCEEYGITPILATIPCVPSRDHTYKNAYIKSMDYRYIDFAKAVNGEIAGATWYTGMLSNDNLHPSALGAMALYSQVLADFPEIMR